MRSGTGHRWYSRRYRYGHRGLVQTVIPCIMWLLPPHLFLVFFSFSNVSLAARGILTGRWVRADRGVCKPPASSSQYSSPSDKRRVRASRDMR